PRGLLDLRDHLIRTAAEAEIIDVAAAERRGERAADIAHLPAELRRLVALDLHRALRLVEAQIGVDEQEIAARLRFLEEILRNGIELLERLRRLDDELDRQAESARQRGR